MKRIAILAGVIAAVLAVAVVVGGSIFGLPGGRTAEVSHRDTAAGPAQRLAEVKTVHGLPVTDVSVNGKPAKAIAGELLVKTTQPDRLKAVGQSVAPTGLPNTYKVDFAAAGNLAAQSAQVAAVPGVQAVSPNYIVAAATTPNDPLYSSQWALPKISAPTAWDRTTGSSSVNIASIDTGVNWNHQDLTGRNWVNTGEIPNNGIDDDNNGYVDDYNGMDFVNATYSGGKYYNDANGPMDDHGHGSLTTSVFSADTNNGVGVAGVTWTGKYIPVKVLDANGFGTFADVAAGIRYASVVGAKVMNMSLGANGVDSDFATDDAIDYAYGRGGVLVAASGNEASASVVDYPAINPEVIAVGSTTSTDARSSFSNGGPQLDLVAPGSSILTAKGVSGGVPVNNQYGTYSGTSLATPFVSGAAALVAAVSPNISPDLVRTVLVNGADQVAGMNGQTRTDLYGSGRLDVRQTLDLLAPYSAQWAGQSAYPTLASGNQTTVHVDYRNTGSQAWSSSGANPVRLGLSHPRDRSSPFYSSSWISPNRAGSFIGRVNGDGSVTTTSTIQPGETARFEFAVTAPPVNSTTTFQEYFQPVVEGVTWLQDYGVFLNVTVQPRTYSYAFAGQTYPPAVLQPGQRRTVTLDLTNTGTATWRNDTLQAFRVGTARPHDRSSAFANNTWQSSNRVAKFQGTVSGGVVTLATSVASGQTARFSFDLVAPSQPGLYNEYFEPLVETYRWLGDIGIFWQVYVPNLNGPNYDYQYVGQSAYPTVNQGGTATVKLQLRNAGRQTWHSDGATPVRLGTDHPRDRLSGFSNNGTGTGWISANRVKLTRNLTDPAKDVGGETSIAPGEVAEFQFTAYGAPSPGSYNEYFTPVTEGVTWMPDIGIFWTMTVQKPINVGLAPQATFTGTSDGPVNFVDSSGTVLATVPAGTSVTNTWNGSTYFGIWPGGSVSSAQPITLRQDSINNLFTVQNLGDNGSFNRFRGNLTIKNGGPGSWLVNNINLEEYLRGIGEVPDSWPIEAIKAQAVAARTYAARRITNPQNALFDIYDDTRDQVYNGYNGEAAHPNQVTAVNATKGVAIYNGGQLIQAFYSSDSGGHTGNNEDVWGGSPISYLRGVSDPYQKPDVWSKTVANTTLQSNYGHSGNVDVINILEYYADGRIKTIRLTTNGGNVDTYTLPADTQRSRLTTRSSLITSLGRSGNDWVFNGRGYGHGIGLAQWGAYNQAAAGRGYGQILQSYYTGVTLGNLY